MVRYRFYVGTLDSDGNEVKHDAVRAYLVETWGGYSATPVDGAWRDDAGKVWYETSIVYEVLVDTPRGPWIPATDHARALRQLAKQSSVLYTREQIEGGFVSR